jgi:hypothetical protein
MYIFRNYIVYYKTRTQELARSRARQITVRSLHVAISSNLHVPNLHVTNYSSLYLIDENQK